MNLRRLEYFVVLGQVGNLRKAGEILNLSAPALSKAMKTLEDEASTKLWIRDGRKIILTDKGKSLMREAPGLIDNFKSVLNALNAGVGPRPIRIGTFEVFSTYFLSFLKNLEWDDNPIELHELLPGEIEKYLNQGELCYGITYMPVPDPNLDFMKITSIEMGVYTRKDAFKGVPQPDLPFVIPATPLQNIPTRMRGLDGWPEDAYQRNVKYKVTLLESALELCRQGRVAGYFPVFIANEHNDRVKEEFKLERRKSPYPNRVCKSDVFLVKRKSDEESATVKQLAKAIRLICK